MIANVGELLAGPLPDVRVGIGRGSSRGCVERSAEAFDGVRIYDDAESLVTDLMSGEIDVAVRGDLTSESMIPAVRAGMGLDRLERASDLARRIGMDARIAVMSGGRDDDRGRCPEVDRTIDSSAKVVDALVRDGYDAYGCQILIEDAVRNAGVVMAPDGMTGNIMFRTLHFLGGAQALGAPVLNAPRVFVDTSRAKTDYRDSIALAKRLTEA